MTAHLFPVTATHITEFRDTPSEAIKIITDFLHWAEREKGLLLCEPYKPQYDWFIPILYRSKDLVAEFLRATGPKSIGADNRGG